jgi:hypothetical protein
VIGFGSLAVPADPNSPDVRMYRVRRDYFFMTNDELRREASDFFEVPLADVTQLQMTQVRSQYETDWNEWPVTYGAPYIERNGVLGYQPPPAFGQNFTVDSLISGNYDEPGLAGANTSFPADQVVWTVYNDLNRTLSISTFGSEPFGLEIQVTLWAYKSSGPLGQSYFKRIRMINKGGVDRGGGNRGFLYLDSMHIAQWADADLGSFADDLAGCDSTGKMGFVFNGNWLDREFGSVGLPPPALGYGIVQGPLARGSASDTAIFKMSRRIGYKNLRMTSFAYFATGAGFADPPFTYEGALRWWRLLHGYVPDPSSNPWRLYLHPPGYPTSFYPLSGDPVAQSGFLDGVGQVYSLAPGDRRIVMNTGAFRLAPGDTQEVVYAITGGLGADRISSFAVMRSNMRQLQSVFNTLFAMPTPIVSARVSYPTPSDAAIRVTANPRGLASTVFGALKRANGSTVVDLVLYDDGTHGDSVAGDGIWTNSVSILREKRSLLLDLRIASPQGRVHLWEKVAENITIAGLVQITAAQLFSDNINSDGRANPGENIRYGVTTSNRTQFSLEALRVVPIGEPEVKLRAIPSLAAGSNDVMIYIPSSGSSFFSVNIPASYTDTLFRIAVEISDTNGNRWSDAAAIRVYPFDVPIRRAVLNHIAGLSSGDFSIQVVNPNATMNHLYVIRGHDSIDTLSHPGFTLKDSTDGRILLSLHPLPDEFGHNIPVTDGFKVMRGTIETAPGFRDWSVPSGVLRFTASNANGFAFEGFDGAIGWSNPHMLFGVGQGIPRPISVLLKLAPTDTSGNYDPTHPDVSYAYRYGRAFTAPPARPEFAPFMINRTGSGYIYQQFAKSVPLSAWDINTTPPRRLALGHLENNAVGGLVDGKWWPGSHLIHDNVSASGPREWLWIATTTYSETPDPQFQRDPIQNAMPYIWFVTVNRLGSTHFAAGDEFFIRAKYPPATGDVWTFNPTVLVGVSGDHLPFTFALWQNYPNPFNPSTTFRYQLPAAGKVTLRVFNLLGQEVRSLIDEAQDAGDHQTVWDGTNNRGLQVGTGVYFYRLEVKTPTRGMFTKVNKMILMR